MRRTGCCFPCAAAPVSGQLLTFSTSQTITTVGSAYFCLVGAAGGSVQATGSTGAVVTGRVALTGSLPFVAGVAGSPGNNGGSTPATDGTASTFAGFTAPGGLKAVGTTPGAAVSPNGVAGAIVAANGNATATAAVISGWPFMTMGSTGSGAGQGLTGAGVGIGTGGNGASAGNSGNPATGFGASGGGVSGSAGAGNLAGASTGGVLYLLVFA